MSSYDRQDAEVTAVFISRRIGPDKLVYRRAAYDLVTYPDGKSGLEPVPVVSMTNAGVLTQPSDFEFDNFAVYESDPFSDVSSF